MNEVLKCPYCTGEIEMEFQLDASKNDQTERLAQVWRCRKCYIPFFGLLVRNTNVEPGHPSDSHLFWNVPESLWQRYKTRMRLCKERESRYCNCDHHDLFRTVEIPPDGELVDLFVPKPD